MLVMRPVTNNDLDEMFNLAHKASYGLTSLPRDKELLKKRIVESQYSFERPLGEPQGQLYIFVLEETEGKKILGTSAIISKVGGFEPFYAYRIETSVHESKLLNVRKEVKALHIVAEHSGPCEIGGLFLAPDYRKKGSGRLLSLSRFLFMAEHRESFESAVIAEMRGVVDDKGRSPFWEALGRHFFDIDFPKADYLSMKNKKFIADLMPEYPIYIPLLSKEAQAVIDEVHERTKPALKMLMDEGFSRSGMVDIFEAGPVVLCQLNEIRTVRESVRSTVSRITEEDQDSENYIIGNTLRDFRATIGKIKLLPEEGVALSKEVALVLKLKVGDEVRYASLRPSPGRKEKE